MNADQHRAAVEAGRNVDSFIASVAGVKAHFMAGGWSEANAEEMTLELFRKLATAGEA